MYEALRMPYRILPQQLPRRELQVNLGRRSGPRKLGLGVLGLALGLGDVWGWPCKKKKTFIEHSYVPGPVLGPGDRTISKVNRVSSLLELTV